MKKIKILQMPIRNAKGGITQYALRNWKHIDKDRFRFDWVTLDGELDFERELTGQGCKVYHIGCRQEDDENRFRAGMEKILANGYDAIHLHTSYWRGFMVEELALQANVPKIIVHAHSSGIDNPDQEERNKLLRAHNEWKARFTTELATHFVACSNNAAEFLYGPQIPRGKIRVLNNAIDVDRFAYNPQVRAKYRREMGLENRFVIGHAGRFEYQKNHDFLIDVFAEISKKIPDARLMLVGAGADFEKIRTKTEQLNLTDSVLFLGKRDDMAELYQAMDIFAFPSRFEGFGLVLVEAQTSGLTCVVASASALLENTITNRIISLPFEIGLWRDAIIDAKRNEHSRHDRSAEIAAAGYSLKEQIKVLEKIYSGEEVEGELQKRTIAKA